MLQQTRVAAVIAHFKAETDPEHEDVVNAGTKYAQYIPPGVIRGMLGFPEEDIEHFLEMVHVIMEGIDHPEEERIIEFEPIEAYFTAQMEDHMDSPRDDLTSYLLNVELEGQNLALEHVFGTMVLILVAGTSANLKPLLVAALCRL